MDRDYLMHNELFYFCLNHFVYSLSIIQIKMGIKLSNSKTSIVFCFRLNKKLHCRGKLIIYLENVIE